MRRKDRLRLLDSRRAESVDDRASAVTSNTEEAVTATTTRTLHAQQVEVIEVDRDRLVDRVIEFVSSSIVVRTLSRAGTAGSIVSCVLGGGAVSLYQFADTKFFTLTDTNQPFLVCLPKRIALADFRRLVESTLRVKCVSVPQMMSFLSLAPAVVAKLWQVSERTTGGRIAEVTAHDAQLTGTGNTVVLDHEKTGAGAFFELGSSLDVHHRVSASQSHMNAAVDELLRLLHQRADVRTLRLAIRAATSALFEHKTAGRLAGGVPYVHAVQQLISALAFVDSNTVSVVEDELAQALVNASSLLVRSCMEFVASDEAAESIVRSIVTIFSGESRRGEGGGERGFVGQTLGFALCTSIVVLSVSPEDTLYRAVTSVTPSRPRQGRIIHRMVMTAAQSLASVRVALRPKRFERAEEVAQHLIAFGVNRPLTWNRPTVPPPGPGTVEALFAGSALILVSAERFLDDAILNLDPGAQQLELQDICRDIFCMLPQMVSDMCLVICELSIAHPQLHTLGMLLRWFTAMSTLLRRSNMLCGMLGLPVATGVGNVTEPHPVSGALVHAATCLVLAKGFIAPLAGSGAHVSSLSFIAHQWMVKLGIAAGTASRSIIISVLDEFTRTVFGCDGVNHRRLEQTLNEAVTVFEGLAASVPSPSPMLLMWQEVVAVTGLFRTFVCGNRELNHHVVARRLAAIVATPSIVEQRYRGSRDPFMSAEMYLSEAPWDGLDERIDATSPHEFTLSMSAVSQSRGSTDNASAPDDTPLSTIANFGVAPLDLAAMGPSLTYVWPTLLMDIEDGRYRSLAQQLIEVSDEVRDAGGPLSVARCLAVMGSMKLTAYDAGGGSLKLTRDAATIVAKAFGESSTQWLDPHQAMHLSASLQERATGKHIDSENFGGGSTQLPPSVRVASQAQGTVRAGRATVLDHVAVAYA